MRGLCRHRARAHLACFDADDRIPHRGCVFCRIKHPRQPDAHANGIGFECVAGVNTKRVNADAHAFNAYTFNADA